jgi:hypothetical protein
MWPAAVAVFAWLAVVSWVDARRKEREAFYRSETIRRLAETGGQNAALEFLRKEEGISALKAREGLKLIGLISIFGGTGFGIFMSQMVTDEPAWLIGIVPVMVGIAMLIYVYLLATQE